MVQSDRPTTQSSNRHSRNRASAKMTLVNVHSRKTFSEISPPRKSRSRKALPSMRSSAKGSMSGVCGETMRQQVGVRNGIRQDRITGGGVHGHGTGMHVECRHEDI